MPKTDKELAVELIESFISAWYGRKDVWTPIDGQTLQKLLNDAYSAISSLPGDA
jgi:hypothetical protein